MTMWPNGLSALGAIDPSLLSEVKKAGSVIRRQTFQTPEGSTTVDTAGFERKHGQPLLSVFWKTLHSQLADAVGLEMIEMGCNCCDIVEEDDGVLIHFEDGRAVKAQCVLAADGIHSGNKSFYDTRSMRAITSSH